MKKVSKLKKNLFLCLFSILFVQIFNKENLRFSYHKIKDLVTLKDMIFLDKEKYSNQLKKMDNSININLERFRHIGWVVKFLYVLQKNNLLNNLF